MGTFRLQHYPDEHYQTLFNPETGFFVRVEESGYDEPFWSAHGPEMLDISITSWCSRECETCYRMAGRMGRHMTFPDYENVIHQAAQLGVTQVALGGGNPNEHPDFAEILRLTRRNYGIVPNYTTNGRGLSPTVLHASAEQCGAVAVSVYEPYSFVAKTVRILRNYGIRTNLHFVLDAHSVETALSWLRDPPTFMSQVNAIVFLNYKPVGRGTAVTRLLCRANLCRDLIEKATTNVHSFKVGFDSCMISGLVKAAKVNPIWYDACEAARFSMFVSEKLQMYPCSFMEKIYPGISLTDSNMLDAWQNGKSFQAIRRALRNPGCNRCNMQTVCRGGCPILPSINLCK
ncbi:MAG: radical SAM protein [Deltaproteobacteria bacterium]|nr:radical SAM protein [Deltaproteobacteria bacterium]